MSQTVVLTQRVDAIGEQGERRDALDQRWSHRIDALGAVPVPIPNRLDDPVAFLAALEPSLLILTGGNDLARIPGATATAPERDRTERVLLRAAAASGIPVLGVCRGFQMMMSVEGATVERVDHHAGSWHDIDVCGTPHWPLDPTRTVNSFHNWGFRASAIPVGWEIVATAPDGTVEAVQHSSRHEIGIMWHPERGAAMADDLALLRLLLGGR